MPEFSAGSMSKTITIQTEVRTSDGGGGYVQSFITNFTTRSSVTPITGDEKYTQGQLSDTQLYEFVMRYRADKVIIPSNRILFGSRVFQIRRTINHMERNKYWVIRAEEKVAT